MNETSYLCVTRVVLCARYGLNACVLRLATARARSLARALTDRGCSAAAPTTRRERRPCLEQRQFARDKWHGAWLLLCCCGLRRVQCAGADGPAVSVCLPDPAFYTSPPFPPRSTSARPSACAHRAQADERTLSLQNVTDVYVLHRNGTIEMH
jgi:hypothetical protein